MALISAIELSGLLDIFFTELLIWLWIEDWIPGLYIWCVVLCTFDPFGSEVVCHCAGVEVAGSLFCLADGS